MVEATDIQCHSDGAAKPQATTDLCSFPVVTLILQNILSIHVVTSGPEAEAFL